MDEIYNKLVRDKIPEIIRNNGEVPIIRELSNEEYWEYLLLKVIEELEEVKNSLNNEEKRKELADMLELIIVMAKYNGFTLEDIINTANEKREKNGSFDKKILLEKVIVKKE